MDDIVKAAMAKWPQVPDCTGWLGLDDRGRWCLRDDRAQAAGAFQSGVAAARGSVLQHEGLVAFIGRNYQADALGRWYFQNGPQKVFVELMDTPWVLRRQPDGQIHTHTGRPVQVLRWWTDELGRLVGETDAGPGLLHSADVAAWADAWTGDALPELATADLPARFGFVLSPAVGLKKHR